MDFVHEVEANGYAMVQNLRVSIEMKSGENVSYRSCYKFIAPDGEIVELFFDYRATEQQAAKHFVETEL